MGIYIPIRETSLITAGRGLKDQETFLSDMLWSPLSHSNRILWSPKSWQYLKTSIIYSTIIEGEFIMYIQGMVASWPVHFVTKRKYYCYGCFTPTNSGRNLGHTFRNRLTTLHNSSSIKTMFSSRSSLISIISRIAHFIQGHLDLKQCFTYTYWNIFNVGISSSSFHQPE